MNEGTSNHKTVQAVPEGFHTVAPFLIVRDAEKFIEFLKDAFDAQQVFLIPTPDGKVLHATIKIGNSCIMISDLMEGQEPINAMLYLYLEDVDSVFSRAIDAKATLVREPKNEFFGDRAGAVKDAWGNTWWIATHVEDVEGEELDKRAKAAFAEMAADPTHAS